MRIRYCPKCNKAGLKWDDGNGKGSDGLTDKERLSTQLPWNWNTSLRYCPRCCEWVLPTLTANFDQHKK